MQADSENLKRLAGTESGDIKDLKGFTGGYVRLLSRLIEHPLKVAIVAILLIVGTFQLFGKYNNGVTFFVDTEPQQALMYVRARGNLSVHEKLRLTRQVEDIVRSVDGIETVSTQAGASSGNNIGTGAGLDQPKDAIGQLTIEFEPYGTRRPGKEIIQTIRERTSVLPGIIVETRQREDGPATGKDIRLQVRADSPETANKTATIVRQHLENNVSGLIDIEDETPLPGIEWTLRVNREEAGRFGADIVSVGAMVQVVTNGVLVGTYRPDDSRDEVDIRVRLPEDERAIERLNTLRLQTRNGLVPLSNFVTREVKPAVDSIVRKDGRVSVFVKANAAPGVLADEKVKELDGWLKSQQWPGDVQFVFRGADEEQKSSQAFLMKAMMAGIFIMFMILLTQFNSFYHTFLTLSTLVMSIAGVLIGMMVMGQAFSVIMTGTGVVALAGIVVNNAIVLIDTFHNLRDKGFAVRDAVLRTGAQRLRPVLLTTITTIFGLLPMIYQINVNWMNRTVDIGSVTSSWWVQLATAISFGLAFATLLTLILTPTLLAAPTIWRERIAHWRGKFGRKRVEAEKSADADEIATEPAGELPQACRIGASLPAKLWSPTRPGADDCSCG